MIGRRTTACGTVKCAKSVLIGENGTVARAMNVRMVFPYHAGPVEESRKVIRMILKQSNWQTHTLIELGP